MAVIAKVLADLVWEKALKYFVVRHWRLGIAFVAGLVVGLTPAHLSEYRRINLPSSPGALGFSALSPADWPSWVIDPFIRSLDRNGNNSRITGVIVSKEITKPTRAFELHVNPATDGLGVDGQVLVKVQKGLLLLPKPIPLSAGSGTLYACVPATEGEIRLYLVLGAGPVTKDVKSIFDAVSLDVLTPNRCPAR